MNISDTARLVGSLIDAYPNGKASEDSIRSYHLALEDLPAAAVERAVISLIRTSTFLPSAAEIRREVYHSEGIETGRGAWASVFAIVRKGPPFPQDTLPIETATVLRSVGGFSAIYMSMDDAKDVERTRRRFIEEYDAFLTGELKQPRVLADKLGVLDNGTEMGAHKLGTGKANNGKPA